MKVAETEILGLIYKNSIDIRNVDAVLNYGCAYQHVIIAVDEVYDPLLQFIPVHLAVSDAGTYAGTDAADYIFNRQDVFNLVVKEKYLSAAVHLSADYVADGVLIEVYQFGGNGDPVGRRSADDRKIAGT